MKRYKIRVAPTGIRDSVVRRTQLPREIWGFVVLASFILLTHCLPSTNYLTPMPAPRNAEECLAHGGRIQLKMADLLDLELIPGVAGTTAKSLLASKKEISQRCPKHSYQESPSLLPTKYKQVNQELIDCLALAPGVGPKRGAKLLNYLNVIAPQPVLSHAIPEHLAGHPEDPKEPDEQERKEPGRGGQEQLSKQELGEQELGEQGQKSTTRAPPEQGSLCVLGDSTDS